MIAEQQSSHPPTPSALQELHCHTQFPTIGLSTQQPGVTATRHQPLLVFDTAGGPACNIRIQRLCSKSEHFIVGIKQDVKMNIAAL